ncbi:MAG: hypothetical protein ACRELY_31945 [Polyangiaceae bacterium]
MLRRLGFSQSTALAAVAIFSLFSAGCSGGASSSGGCGAHSYTYVAIPAGGYAGAGWYSGDLSGGWYDPGDDGNDYSGIGDGSGSGDDGTYYDDGSGDNGSYDDGSGDNGSYDDGSGDNGSYDDGSGDNGSGDYGSGSSDDGSGDDGSGDDGTAATHHLHLASANLHTQTTHASCYAYTCTLVCAVDSASAREAQGFSGISQQDACITAQHGLENWAHDSLGEDIGACKQVSSSDSSGASPAAPGSRTPAAPSVTQGFSSSPPRSFGASATRAPR